MKVPKHKKAARRGMASQILSNRFCFNCGQQLKFHEGHFFPPCMGDEGFFICAPQKIKEGIDKPLVKLQARN